MYSITNLANTIKNAQQKYKYLIKYPVSTTAIDLTTALYQQNIIRGFFIDNYNQNYCLSILLKYGGCNSKHIFKKIILVSKSFSHKQKMVLKFQNGFGLYIISTTKGFMSNSQCTKLKIGGFVLIQIF